MSHEVTQLLLEWSRGDERALEELVPLVYGELRRLARRHLSHERPGHTLQPTALVHEAYLRLAGQRQENFEGRTHFLRVAAQIMRRILVDHARKHKASKRGGEACRLSLDEALEAPGGQGVDLVALDQALKELEQLDPQQSRIVELRYFGGLSIAETATAAGVSPATVKRDWVTARAWLRRQIGRGLDHDA